MKKPTKKSGIYILAIVLPLLILLPASAATLTSGDAKLQVTDTQITLRRQGKSLFKLTEIAFNYHRLSSWTIRESSAEKIILRGNLPAAVDFYRSIDDSSQRTFDIEITAVQGGFRLYAAPDWGRQVSLGFDHIGDHFFGLSAPLQPDNQLSPDLTGAIIDVEVNSEDAQLQENYATAYSAFYLSSFGYGAFFDTFARGRYSFAINGKNRIHHDTGALDWYVFTGDDGADIHRAYYALIGSPKKLPIWGLGPIGWRDQNDGGAAEIVSDVERMTALQIPFTAWFVDRPYSDGAHAWSELNFNQAFANPGDWISRLRQKFGLEFMTWVATSTFGDARFEKHLSGEFTYIDLSHPQSVQAYQEELREKQHRYGVKGHKIDRGDESFPVYETWHDATPAAERRNKYAWLMAKTHDEVLRQTWGEEQLTFTRAAIHRSQAYLSAIWGGDPRTTWEGLQSNFANAMRSSFMGFPVWGTDVGGYQGDGYIPEDLYIRWMQAGSVTGLFEIKLDGAGGSGRDRMPWQYNKKFQERFRKICEDRMKFIPYLYSLATTSAQTGPLMQPMAYRHLQDKNTYALWDQFYVGPAILVAPVFNAGTSRSVYLPKGEWRSLDNPSVMYRGGTRITVAADLDTLPRFVKANSIYVTGNLYRGNDRGWRVDAPQLTIHAFPGESTTKETFRYVDIYDNDKIKEIRMISQARRVILSSAAIATPVKLAILLAKEPKSVLLNGGQVNSHYDQQAQLLTLAVPVQKDFLVELAL